MELASLISLALVHMKSYSFFFPFFWYLFKTLKCTVRSQITYSIYKKILYDKTPSIFCYTICALLKNVFSFEPMYHEDKKKKLLGSSKSEYYDREAVQLQ